MRKSIYGLQLVLGDEIRSSKVVRVSLEFWLFGEGSVDPAVECDFVSCDGCENIIFIVIIAISYDEATFRFCG